VTELATLPINVTTKDNSMAIGHGDTDVSDIPKDKTDESDKDDGFLTKKISEQLSAFRCGESSRDKFNSDDKSYSQHIAALAEKRTFPNSLNRQTWISYSRAEKRYATVFTKTRMGDFTCH
jgi:hypothetical protein